MAGANVGTCVTGLIASIGRSREALRLAVALLLFRLVSALLVLPFGDRFNRLVAYLCGIDRASIKGDHVSLMLATSHTVFNLIFALATLPFCHKGVAFIRWLIPPSDVELKGMSLAATRQARGASRGSGTERMRR
jgi:phosphate:Na+ symporter